MKNSTNKSNNIYFFLGILFLFGVWFVSSLIVNNSGILPNIDEVFVELLKILKDANTYTLSMNFEEGAIGTRLARNFNVIQPWSNIRKCNIKDGQVVCYENEEVFIEDGTNGDVMVEIPKFYYKVVPVEIRDIDKGKQIVEAKWMISQSPAPDFKIHPAFVRNGVEINNIYVGAFENGLIDNQLMSVAGIAPLVSNTLSEVQDLCITKGNGFEVMDILTLSALQLLFVIEHSSFDSQRCAGQGLVSENNASNTGADNAINYRGIENLWGNVWNIVNGLDLQLAFNVADNGFIDGFGYDANNDFLFIPISANGSSSIPPCDIHEQDGITNKLISVMVGNMWNSNINAGLFSYKLSNDAEIKSDNIGSRLQFYK